MKSNHILKQASLFNTLAQDSLSQCDKVDYHIERIKSRLRDLGLEIDILLNPDMPLNDLGQDVEKGTTWKTKLWSAIQPSSRLDEKTKLSPEQLGTFNEHGNELLKERDKLLKTLRQLKLLKTQHCSL